MKRRIAILLILLMLITVTANADVIRWVDFQVPYESLEYAMHTDIDTYDKEKHIDWVDPLALAACRTGGRCGLASVKMAVKDLQGDRSPEELLGELYKYYSYSKGI